MSTAISGFLTTILWGAEATQGTEASTFPYLWNSEDSDGLSFGETPFDTKPLTGVRGQKSTTYRVVQNLPGGDLGKAPLAFGTDSTETLKLMLAHFQSVTQTGTEAPYTYTFSPVTTAIAEGSFETISVIKSTGITGKAHLYTGGIVDALTIDWESAGVISVTPTVKFMASSHEGTMPALVAPTPNAGGYLQAPNIAMTWNGTAVHPSKFSIESNTNTPDRQSGDARGRYDYAVGNYDSAISIDVWRNENSDTNWVNPFYSNTVGTLVITATMDTSYGTITGGSAVTMVYTAYCMLNMPNDMPVNKEDVVDSVELRVVSDTALPTLSITAESTGLVS